MSLMGVVQSVEDHGYVIDSGIANLRTFLSTKAAENWCKTLNKGKPLGKFCTLWWEKRWRVREFLFLKYVDSVN